MAVVWFLHAESFFEEAEEVFIWDAWIGGATEGYNFP